MNDQATLQAGGIVPTNSKLDKGDAVDVVVARAYVHPVMPNRTVVRLCAEGVAPGDELEMSTLGFGAGDERGEVGKERRRPLGFPGWCLVNDPKNARYALDVVKELKKHARKAKSKPGHAKDAFDAIAAKLSKTVPHFLPSFYEEVGRVFIEHGAIAYASQMFGKARQVEAVHALEVDEQHRIDGFLEFALAGAVTTKALSEYGKELSSHHEPKAAYAHFRQLCVQRTLGGMPPWSGMAKDLGRLAKAAKLDSDKEDAALIAEIIESPALAKAAGEFWRAYAEPMQALAKANVSARGVLLDLFPVGNTNNANTELDDIWLDLLESSGAVDALIGESELKPANGRAAWFDKLCAHTARGYRGKGIPARVFALLRRMAPALIADGTPIKGSSRYRVDLDLAELALELGVAVDPPEGWAADGNQWAAHATEPERGRDPVLCSAHPKLAAVLRGAVVGSIGNEAFDQASRGKQGFLAAKRQWLEGMLTGIEAGALPALDAALTAIDSKARASTFAELPDLHARFAALDLAPSLARTLQVGLIDELGWPALEAVVAELGKTEITLHGAPAALVVATKTKAIAIVGNERKGEHDFVIPPKHELQTVRYIGDQFLVVIRESYNKIRAYWSNTPNDIWDAEGLTTYSVPTSGTAAVLADGAWLEGNRAIRPGDRILPFATRICGSDGVTSWITEWKDGEHRWREVTASGELGRYSFPAWLEEFAADGWKIDNASSYLPAPAWLTESPLGVANGFIGNRVRWRGSNPRQKQQRELETIDGVKLTSQLNVQALLALPDGGERRPLEQDHNYSQGTTIVIHEPACRFVGSRAFGGEQRYSRGQVVPVSISFLHNYSARDVSGSKRLHGVTDDDARALLAAAPMIEDALAARPDDLPGVLPEITHPLLRKGLTGVAIAAKELIAKRDRLAADRAPGKAQTVTSVGPDDATLFEALPGWLRQAWTPAGSAWTQIERTAALFADEDRSDRIVKDLCASPADWFELALMRPALPVLAVAIGTPEKLRPVVAQLYEHLCKLPAADKLRVVHVKGGFDKERFQLHWNAGNAYAVRNTGYSSDRCEILEYAPTGQFKLPWPLEVQRETRGVVDGPSPEEVHAAVAAKSVSWSEAAAERLSAETGLSRSEAVFLWAGCPSQSDRDANFMDKELREQLGLKAAQAAIARDALNIPKFHYKVIPLAELGRAGLAAILDGSGVSTLATAWKQRFGERVSIPEELIAKADAQDLSKNIPGVLGMILGGEESPQLTVDGAYAFDLNGTLIRASKPEPLVGQTKLDDSSPHFDASTIQLLAVYLPFLYAELPVGDPLRALAGKAHELALERLKSPTLWIGAGSMWFDKDKLEEIEKQLELLGGELLPGVAETVTLRRLPGAAIQRAGLSVTISLRPSERDAKAKALLEPVSKQVSNYVTTGRDVDYLRSPELAAMMARIAETPVPEGGWEQNPMLSASALVDKVSKKLKVSREAAALYLQYLVLLWPTPKALAEYNGWKPKQLAEAQAELVEKELILEAKRERAQRGHFLPGGWEALKSPHPPMETWKQRHIYPAPGAKYQAKAPFHALFEHAWKLIEDGNEPRYEEVKR